MVSISNISFGNNDKIIKIDNGVQNHKNQKAASKAQYLDRQIKVPQFMLDKERPAHLPDRLSNLEADTFEPENKEVIIKRANVLRAALAFLAGAAFASGVSAAKAPKPVPEEVAVIFNPSDDTMDKFADLYGTDEDIIRLYNNIPQNSDLDEITQITIPSEYDNIQTEIESEQDKLFKKNLSQDKRTSIEENIQALKAKQSLQQKVATSFTDGEYVYYSLNNIEELPEYENGINIEDFKKLFDIEDGAIQKYNSLENCQWSVDENGKGGTIDFTKSYLHSGDLIKVDSEAVNEDVDLSDFTEENIPE